MMNVLLETETFVLEELKPQAPSSPQKNDNTNNHLVADKIPAVASPPVSLRPNASHCYWLVHDRITGTLGVGRDTLPDCPGDQIFRLSLLSSSSLTPEPSPQPQQQLQPGESEQVGTELLCQDDHVQIWEFRLEPQERCAYHRHLKPYFFLNLTHSVTQELDAQGQPVTTKDNITQTPGQCTVVASNDLSAHAVRNVGTNVFLQFVVEFVPCLSKA